MSIFKKVPLIIVESDFSAIALKLADKGFTISPVFYVMEVCRQIPCNKVDSTTFELTYSSGGIGSTNDRKIYQKVFIMSNDYKHFHEVYKTSQASVEQFNWVASLADNKLNSYVLFKADKDDIRLQISANSVSSKELLIEAKTVDDTINIKQLLGTMSNAVQEVDGVYLAAHHRVKQQFKK